MEFELKMTNGSWNDKLSDLNSAAFLKLKKNLEEEFDKAFCGEPGTTVSCRTEVTGFSEGSINVFFLIIRTELKQFLLGVAQLLVGFVYTFLFFLSLTSSILTRMTRKHPYFLVLFSLALVLWLSSCHFFH